MMRHDEKIVIEDSFSRKNSPQEIRWKSDGAGSSGDESLTASEIEELGSMLLPSEKLNAAMDVDGLDRYRRLHVARSYGGDFAWCGATYTLEVHKGRKGPSLLQWLNRLTSKLLLGGSVVFVADGRFRRPGDSKFLFPIGNIDLRWRYDTERSRIVIDHFDKGELIPWRSDELQPYTQVGHASHVLEGVGHIGKHIFTYTMRNAATKDAADKLSGASTFCGEIVADELLGS